METKEFSAVLLSVDEMEYERQLHFIQSRLIPQLEKIKNEFLKLNLGQLNDEFLKDILFGEMQLTRSRLTDKQRYENKNVLSVIQKLLDEFSEPGNMEIPIVIDYPSVDENGNIVLTEEAIAALRDSHSNYVCTERGIELLELHRKAAAALNEFFQKATPYLTFNEFGEIFVMDFQGNVVPAVLPYDLFNYAKQPQKQN